MAHQVSQSSQLFFSLFYPQVTLLWTNPSLISTNYDCRSQLTLYKSSDNRSRSQRVVTLYRDHLSFTPNLVLRGVVVNMFACRRGHPGSTPPTGSFGTQIFWFVFISNWTKTRVAKVPGLTGRNSMCPVNSIPYASCHSQRFFSLRSPSDECVRS